MNFRIKLSQGVLFPRCKSKRNYILNENFYDNVKIIQKIFVF